MPASRVSARSPRLGEAGAGAAKKGKRAEGREKGAAAFELKMENLGDPYDDRVMKNVPPIARDPLKREEAFGNLTPGAKPLDD